MINRKSIIVYFKSTKALKFVDALVDIKYYTKKSKYAICYVTDNKLSETIQKLKEIKLVTKVEESLLATME